MSLSKLVAHYAEQDLSIPVEYYTPTGITIRGAIQRLDGDVAMVVSGTLPDPMRVKINVKGLAGAANPQEWCLNRYALNKYNDIVTADSLDTDAAEKVALRQRFYQVFDSLKAQGDDVTYHTVVSWPGLLTEDIVAFASFNIHNVEQPLSGFLYMTNGTARFVHAVPMNVKLNPM
ncbi:hypothetical protein [Pseudomonas phage D6]|nr:hypothetical protein [Pseudomonas phage D6]